MKTVIIADSTCDIDKKQVEELGIEIVPLTVSFGVYQYKDTIDLSKAEFFDKLANEPVMPVTSQPSPEAFAEVFKKHKEAGNEVVFISIASLLSGTFQSASIAKAMEECDNVYVVDSLSATAAFGILVKYACQLRDEGKSAKEIYEILEEKKHKANIYAMIGTLKYLIKGGRLSKAAGTIGGVLNVKPIINVKDGKIHTLGKARGKTGAYNDVIERVKELEIDTDMPITLVEASDKEALKEFEALLIENDMKYNWDYAEIGSVVGTHVGPGCVGIAFFEK